MFEKSSENKSLEIFEIRTLNALTKKAIDSNSNHQLDLGPFIDVYGLDTVKNDYAAIADKMSSYMEEKLSPATKMGFIFESAFLDIGQNDWFGAGSEIVRASKFDDIMNAIDMVSTIMKRDDSAHHIAIASDLTYSLSSSTAKFSRILNSVHSGKMAQIKYFHSDLLGFTGRLSNVPRTVVGLDVDNLNVFLKQWLNEPELAQLQYGALILNQIKDQSRGFASLSNNINGADHAMTRAYRRTAETIDEILETNYSNIEVGPDKISTAIKNQSDRLHAENS